MTIRLLERSAVKALSQSFASDNLGGSGCLVLVAAITAVIVFSFLGMSKQRDLYFSAFPQPTAPQGSYATVAVKEFRVSRGFFASEVYVVTLIGTGHLSDTDDKYVTGLVAGSGLVYTLQCEPHFWNHCKPLSPGSTYYARWASLDHTKLAISKLAKGEDGKLWVSSNEMQFYDLLRWEKRDTLQVARPGGLTGVYENGGFSLRYPQDWRLEENKNDNNWRVVIAPTEAHLGTWVTHGFFVGHVGPASPAFPATLDGAFEHSKALFEKRGLDFSGSSKVKKAVGSHDGMMISYTQSSPLAVGERGYLIVTRDDDDGYYYFLMFCPNDEQTQQYVTVFDGVLRTVKFGKEK